MAGKAIEAEMEATLRQELKKIQRELKDLRRLEFEALGENDANLEMDFYFRDKGLRASINTLRVSLDELKSNGKRYPHLRGIRLRG